MRHVRLPVGLVATLRYAVSPEEWNPVVNADLVAAVTRRLPPLRGVLRTASILAKHSPGLRQFPRYRALIDFKNPPEFNLFFRGIYEPETTRVLRTFLRPGDAAIDIGCNCGVVTLEMATCVGPNGRVVAIDPAPASVERTSEQITANSMRHVRVVHAGLDAHVGTLTYALASTGIGALPLTDRQYTTGEEISVPVDTLDAILANEPPPALIKCDTDGHEARVFAGAEQTLAAKPLLYFEITPEAMARRGDNAGHLLAMLKQQGYQFLSATTGRYWRTPRFGALSEGYTGNLIGYTDSPRHREFLRNL